MRSRPSPSLLCLTFSSIAACPESGAVACSEARQPARTACDQASASLEPACLGHESGFRHRANSAAPHPRANRRRPRPIRLVIRTLKPQRGGSRPRVFYRTVEIGAREIASGGDPDLTGPFRAAPLGNAPGCDVISPGATRSRRLSTPRNAQRRCTGFRRSLRAAGLSERRP